MYLSSDKVKDNMQKTLIGWQVCPSCKKMLHSLEIDNKIKLCPKCDFHFTLSSEQRIALLADKGSFVDLFQDVIAQDILGFKDTKTYKERLLEAEEKTGKKNAITAGYCNIMGQKVALGVMDFFFMGGSVGRGEGEKLTRLIEYATDCNLPLIIVSASGGARMQESMYSLMQMAKTSQALKRHDQKGLFYLSVLTNPTMGGVSASFAFLGDVIIAEPDALIGFTGPRVVEQTVGEKLKRSDQRSEFHLENGMIDTIVKRDELKTKIAYFVRMFSKN